MTYDITIDDRSYRVELTNKDDRWRCVVDGREVEVDSVVLRPNVLSILIDGISCVARREGIAGETRLWIGNMHYQAKVADPRSLQSRKSATGAADGARKIVAPMPGKVVRVLVQESSEVLAGQGVVVVEAMKMQNELKSPKQGTVKQVMVAEGSSVNAGDVLMIVE